MNFFTSLIAPPIPGFAPFSLLPDELIIAIATHLPQLKSFPAARERPWSMEQRSIEYFASVDKRIRRLALSVRWEYGHLVKKLVVRAISSQCQVTFQQQLDRTVACLSVCDHMKDLTLRIRHFSDTHSRESLATVFETLAKRASKLEHLCLVSSWHTLDGLEHFEDVLLATTCLKSLCIDGAAFETLQIDNLGHQHHQLHARRIPQLPPLPLLTTLSIPTANFVTTRSFDGTYACKELELAYVRAGDLAHVAKCVGHSIQRLKISSLSLSLYENPPLIFAALRYLKAYDDVFVYLPALLDPESPLETP